MEIREKDAAYLHSNNDRWINSLSSFNVPSSASRKQFLILRAFLLEKKSAPHADCELYSFEEAIFLSFSQEKSILALRNCSHL